MRLPKEILEKIAPEVFPPKEIIPTWASALADSADELRQRIYLWTSVINDKRLSANVGIPVGAHNFSAGFIYVNRDLKADLQFPTAENFVFGAYALVPSKEEIGRQIMVEFDVGNNFRFPLVINYGPIELHGSPPYPFSGSGTCWVKHSASSKSWDTGILTCRHTMAGYPLGSTVSLTPSHAHSTPTSGTLADIDASTIDAAIIKVDPHSLPSGLSSLGISSPVVPGDTIEFTGRSSGPNPGSVLSVFQHPTYYGNLFGQRIVADCSGIAGDSGALLTDKSTGKGLGIYMGIIPDGSGGHSGLFQDLQQAANFFNLDLFI